jgi:predicted DCC family thiol-disulfide oxidoreductase YuxK
MSAGWATAGNLRNILWERWFELSLYMPGFEFPLRLDMMPEPVLELSAFAVIFFEIVFILLVLFRPLRPFLALAALAFHFGNGFLLHIWFKALLPAYVCFFDWTAMGRAAGRWIGVTPLLVFYDGSCRLCIRTIAVLRSIDIFEGLEPVDGGLDDPRKLAQRKLTDTMLAHDLCVIDGGKTLQGYEAYRRIAARLPLLWPAAPLMGWAPVARLGRRLYRKIADSRACSVIRELRPVIARDSACRPLFWMGTLLVSLQTGVSGALFAHDLATEYLPDGHRVRRSLAGFHSWSPVWPFDQYPTFTWTPKEKAEIWEARAVLSSGREMRISARAYAATFGTPARCWRAAQGIKREADPDRHRARSLQLARSLWRHEAAAIRESAVSVNIYHNEYSLDPSHRMPIRRRLIHIFPVALISGTEPIFSDGSNISERVRSGGSS